MVDSHRSNQNSHGSGRAARRGETRGRLPRADALKASATHRGRITLYAYITLYCVNVRAVCVVCYIITLALNDEVRRSPGEDRESKPVKPYFVRRLPLYSLVCVRTLCDRSTLYLGCWDMAHGSWEFCTSLERRVAQVTGATHATRRCLTSQTSETCFESATQRPPP